MKSPAPSPSPALRDESGEAGEPISSAWRIAAIGLLGARWLMPTEAPEQGRTLWIVTAWLALGAMWLWRCSRMGTPLGRRDRWDILICGFCGGFVASSIHVLIAGGQRRAALTMLWEWFGLAVAMLLCRRWFREAAARQSLLIGLTSLVVALAGLGVWQHHVWYANLGRQFAEYESLSGRSDLTSAERQRLTELRDELGPEVALLDSSGGDSLRNRVLNSTEPVGRFALANTFAALLIFGIVILLWQSRSLTRPERARSIALVAVCLLLGYVLLLTKSRSAWMGLIAAAAVAIGCMFLLRDARRGMRVFFAGGVAIGLLLAVTWFTGGLDRLVVSEAGKSLRYRFEFWEATWGVIREHPWLGTGPGNFRQNYLKHKLPGSSEEILDPHNLFLEVWAIGGVIPLLALAALLAGTAWSGSRQLRQSFPPVAVNRRVAFWGVACAGLAPLMWNGVLSARWDLQLVAVVGSALVVAAVWAWLSRGQAGAAFDQPATLIAVLAGLVVHLLTSGGIGMPGIAQLVLLTCLFLADGSPPATAMAGSAPRLGKVHAVGALVLAAAVAIAVRTGLIPVMNATTFIQAGDVESLRTRGSERVLESYTLACESDPLDPVPWNRRAQFLMSRWETAGPRPARDRLLSQVVEMQEESLRRDSRNPRLLFELGQWQWRAYLRDHDESNLRSGIQRLTVATALYPNSSLYNGTLSLALNAAGETEPAGQYARNALGLDDSNRAAGHTDRYLPDDMQQELLMIANQPPPDPEGD